LWNRPEYGPLIRGEIAALPVLHDSPRRSLLALSHRNLYHGLMDLLRVDPSAPAHEALVPLLDRYRELYFHRLGPDDEWDRRVLSGLAGVDVTVRRRLDRAEVYDAALDHPRVNRCVGWRASGVVWRYSFTVDTPTAALAVTAALRRTRLNASNHYWSVADLMAGEKNLPGAGYFCPRVVNLWVDDEVSAADLSRTGAVIRRELDQ
jgi:hypothetical protein